jgi:hypothetical protein
VRRSLVLPLLAVLAACASPPGDGGAISEADDALLVHVDRGNGAPAEDWTLSCLTPPQDTHPEAAAACAHLAGLADPFAPLPDDVVCTEQFGGPQTARVTGRWGGAAVDLELSRADGCLIAQWDRLGPLLPIPVGVDAVG